VRYDLGVLGTIRETIRSFASHGGRVLGAATAFYALLSVAPLLLIAIVITGLVTSRMAARQQVVSDISIWIGHSNGHAIGEILERLDEGGKAAGILGLLVLVWASTRLFFQLRYSINHLWGVREVELNPVAFSTRAIRQVRRRLSALLMMFLVVIIIVATVLGKAVLSAAVVRFGIHISTRWHVLEFALSFALLAAMCIAAFKLLPAARISWRDACVGALVTALLFSLGAMAIGFYLGIKGTSSAYGAAGSIVALLVWINYSAQAFFLGAAFTRVHAERHGKGLKLIDGAVRVIEAPNWPPPSQIGRESGPPPIIAHADRVPDPPDTSLDSSPSSHG
jgi:membrane protein